MKVQRSAVAQSTEDEAAGNMANPGPFTYQPAPPAYSSLPPAYNAYNPPENQAAGDVANPGPFTYQPAPPAHNSLPPAYNSDPAYPPTSMVIAFMYNLMTCTAHLFERAKI